VRLEIVELLMHAIKVGFLDVLGFLVRELGADISQARQYCNECNFEQQYVFDALLCSGARRGRQLSSIGGTR
jgi:hypothetical protein